MIHRIENFFQGNKRGIAMRNAVQVQSGSRDATLSVLLGTLTAFLFSILLLVFFSLLMTVQNMPSGVVQLFAFLAVAGGGFAGGILAGRLFRQKGLLLGAVTGFVFLLIVLLVNAAFGQFAFGGMLVFKILAGVLAGAFGGIAGVNMHRRRGRG